MVFNYHHNRLQDEWLQKQPLLSMGQNGDAGNLRTSYESNYLLEYLQKIDDAVGKILLRKLKSHCRQEENFSENDGTEAADELDIAKKIYAGLLRTVKKKPERKREMKRQLCEKIRGFLAARNVQAKQNDDQPLHHHNINRYFKKHFERVSDEQKSEIMEMKKEGESKEAMQQKVLSYYESLSAEKKQEAAELLKSGCHQFLEHTLGEQKTKQLKRMKDSGSDPN
ncbi:unnamed protein product, partial [Gongylonema pulchrum]|uniref:NPA domain-containing protein n=1 Tax=Gongylonema pulchrum TaxID=637853 RepID=A0A183DGQ3_9BILA